jgi:hypothetical protein
MVELMNLSDADLAAQARAVREEKLRRAGKEHSCAKCGAGFYGRADARYCSVACRVAACRVRSRTAPATRGSR